MSAVLSVVPSLGGGEKTMAMGGCIVIISSLMIVCAAKVTTEVCVRGIYIYICVYVGTDGQVCHCAIVLWLNS